MKILVVSNLYPPHHIGGYELGCRDVVERLRARGHEVSVLTSSVSSITDDSHANDARVYRWLPIDLDVRGDAVARRVASSSSFAFARSVIEAEWGAWRAMRRLIARERPDVVYVWNMRYLPMSIVRYAQRAGLPVCFFVSDDWLAHWETVDRWEQWTRHLPADPLRRAAKRLLRAVVDRVRLAGRGRTIDFRHVQFASEFLKRGGIEAGLTIAHPTVVHWGVDAARFRPRDAPPASAAPVRTPVLRVLYAGQVTQAKGVDTLIEALRLLCTRPRAIAIDDRRTDEGESTMAPPMAQTASLFECSIVGGSVQPHYEAALRTRVGEAGLESRVRFTGMLDRARMPDVHREHDVLVFPSVWDEPFSITLLEAMASGLAIVATPTGGTAEIVRDGINALVFPPGDASACADCLGRLIAEPDLRARLGAEARRTIEHAFTLDRMIDAIEADLHEAARL